MMKIDRTTVEEFIQRVLSSPTSPIKQRLNAERLSDSIDEASLAEDTAVAVRELDTIWSHHRLASAAKQKLRNGTYGTCVNCQHAIPESRLLAVPWATRCVRCEAVKERCLDRYSSGEFEAPSHWLDHIPDAA